WDVPVCWEESPEPADLLAVALTAKTALGSAYSAIRPSSRPRLDAGARTTPPRWSCPPLEGRAIGRLQTGFAAVPCAVGAGGRDGARAQLMRGSWPASLAVMPRLCLAWGAGTLHAGGIILPRAGIHGLWPTRGKSAWWVAFGCGGREWSRAR